MQQLPNLYIYILAVPGHASLWQIIAFTLNRWRYAVSLFLRRLCPVPALYLYRCNIICKVPLALCLRCLRRRAAYGAFGADLPICLRRRFAHGAFDAAFVTAPLSPRRLRRFAYGAF